MCEPPLFYPGKKQSVFQTVAESGASDSEHTIHYAPASSLFVLDESSILN